METIGKTIEAGMVSAKVSNNLNRFNEFIASRTDAVRTAVLTIDKPERMPGRLIEQRTRHIAKLAPVSNGDKATNKTHSYET